MPLWCYLFFSLCFFFQAEDGIRDGHVTGVQTCALPISQQINPPMNRRSPRLKSNCNMVAKDPCEITTITPPNDKERPIPIRLFHSARKNNTAPSVIKTGLVAMINEPLMAEVISSPIKKNRLYPKIPVNAIKNKGIHCFLIALKLTWPRTTTRLNKINPAAPNRSVAAVIGGISVITCSAATNAPPQNNGASNSQQ